MATSGNDFWSRRRAAVQAEEQAEQVAVATLAEAEAQAEREAVEAEKTDAELLAELELPDPDTLRMGDDFSAFMKKSVPERLRRRALRRLWLSNPVLANLDGLLDHAGDFTDAATVMPNMATTYQVGKGMLEHVVALAKAAEAKERAAAQEIDATTDVVDDDPTNEPEVAATVAADAPQEVLMAAPMADTFDDPVDDAVEATPQPRRHMRFEFTS